jgi:glycerol-3-phosphate dehydrogenase subunit C
MQHDDRTLDNCVKCSDCNTACPVMKAYPAFSGPKALGPDMERFRKEGVDSDTQWVEYCTGCHCCDVACPHGVNVSELIAKAKVQHKKTGVRAVRDHWLARPALLGTMCSNTAPFSNAIMNLTLNRRLMSSFAGITSDRPFPPYSSKPLTKADGTVNSGQKVVFFPGCFIRYNNPELGRRVVELLRLNGFSVEVATASCCGMPSVANGDEAELMRCVEKNVEEMEPAVDREAPIVTACTSCSYALKGDYAHLPAGKSSLAASAQKLSRNTYDLAELLTERLNGGTLKTDSKATPRRLAYHAPCHLKSQGIGRPWLRLLRAVPGIEIEEIKAECCGMAGTFGFKSEKYPISMDIGEELFEGIAAYQPDLVVTECGSCQMQIEHGTGLKTRHPAEILLEACQAAASTSLAV